ncbi:MAG TPA: class I SAM-dependent methyltransferase [Stellaceae bacterium]|nr:class I SAM-dependent methyltransferase [Stellaceae bacterium]
MPRNEAGHSTIAPGTRVVEQRWDSQRYQRNAGFVAVLGREALDLLAPVAGECILDLGCGDGALTAELAAHARVVAVDQSAEQVAAAQARGLDARMADGTRLAFDREFDAVFSNAALHWMRDPDAVIDGVWRALKPGGRFVAECGGVGNMTHVLESLLASFARRGIDARPFFPWYFASPEEYRAKLERRGFTVRSIDLIPRPTPLPGPLGDWLDTFAESFLVRLPAAERDSVKREVEDDLRRALFKDGVWVADYVRLRFAAVKP